MRSLLDFKRFKLYIWIAVAFQLIGILPDMVQHPGEAGRRFLDDLWRLGFIIFVNYIFFEYTVPRLQWRSFFRSFFLLFGHLLVYSWFLFWWRGFGLALHIYTPFGDDSDEVSTQLGYSLGSILFFGIVRHFYLHIKLKRTTQQLLIEKQRAELNYLKAQTNPHFLFNTLSNIYSLARDKSDKAPESILRLSKILRYMLYETEGPYIAIEQELKIIDDYISLEKLRYDESLLVNFNYDIEDMKQSLPPLLLIPLVENAFKHGASETRNRPFVDIHLSVVNRQLFFQVRNSMESGSDEPKIKERIGLTNLRRQLELLYTDYQILLEQKVSEFSAILKINLASHVKN